MNMFIFIKKILNKNAGQAMVEYGLIAALVGLAMLAGTIYYFESTKVNYYNGMVPLSKGENVPPPPEIKEGDDSPKANQKPVAVIEGPLKSSVGQKLVYTDSSYDLDGSIKHTSWGSKTIERVFYKEGTYLIELEVIDDKGAKGRKEIEVVVGRSIPLAVIYKDKTTRISQADSLLVHAKNSTDPFGDKIVGAKWFLTYPNGSRKEMDWGMEGHKFEPNELEAGVYKLELQVTDEMQDVSDWATSTIQVNKAPIANIVVTPNKFNIGEQVKISSEGSTDPDGDELKEAEWFFTTPDGKRTKMSWGVEGYTFPAGSLNQQGVYKVELRVKDSYNAWSKPIIVTFRTNTKPVAIIYTNPNGTVDMNKIISIHANNSFDSDGDKIVESEWYMTHNGVRTKMSWGLSTHTIDPKTLGAGTVRFELRVKDENGAWSDWTDKTLKLNNPPVAILEIIKGDKPSINGKSSFDTDGTIVKAEWQMQKPNGSKIIISYTSLEGGGLPLQEMKDRGTYYFYLRVQDNYGEWSTWTSQHYINNQKPVAVATFYRDTAKLGGAVMLVGRGSYDPDGEIVEYEWYATKKDGVRRNLNRNEAWFVFDDFSNGNPKIELRVKDNDGEWSDFDTIIFGGYGGPAPKVRFKNSTIHAGGGWYDLDIQEHPNIQDYAFYEFTSVEVSPSHAFTQTLQGPSKRISPNYLYSGDYYPHLRGKFDVRSVYNSGGKSNPTRVEYYPLDPLSFQSHLGRLGNSGFQDVTFPADEGFNISGVQMAFNKRNGIIPSGADITLVLRGVLPNGSQEVVFHDSILNGKVIDMDLSGRGFKSLRAEFIVSPGYMPYYDPITGYYQPYLDMPRFTNGETTIVIYSEQL